jgi:hypothetical protein
MEKSAEDLMWLVWSEEGPGYLFYCITRACYTEVDLRTRKPIVCHLKVGSSTVMECSGYHIYT